MTRDELDTETHRVFSPRNATAYVLLWGVIGVLAAELAGHPLALGLLAPLSASVTLLVVERYKEEISNL